MRKVQAEIIFVTDNCYYCRLPSIMFWVIVLIYRFSLIVAVPVPLLIYIDAPLLLPLRTLFCMVPPVIFKLPALIPITVFASNLPPLIFVIPACGKYIAAPAGTVILALS